MTVSERVIDAPLEASEIVAHGPSSAVCEIEHCRPFALQLNGYRPFNLQLFPIGRF